MTQTTKIDRTMANMIIKKGNFAVENKGKIDEMYANIFVDDEVTQVVFFVEANKENKMVAFRDVIAEYIAKYRRGGKAVNPFVKMESGEQ